MLRYSRKPTRQPDRLTHPTNEAFFDDVRAQGGCLPWIVLVGGSDIPSVRVRQAQSVVRFDGRPSYFSHAAIVLDVPRSGSTLDATGVEIALTPAPRQRHLPERNGATFFRLARYGSRRSFPNIAVISPTTKLERRDGQASAPIDVLRSAALADHPGSDQHAFIPWLARWSAWVLDPVSTSNPLIDGVPFPGAAFCDYAFAAAGLDVVPSASNPALTPEHLWASVRHFADAVEETLGDFRVWCTVRDRHARLPDVESTPSAKAYEVFHDRAR